MVRHAKSYQINMVRSLRMQEQMIERRRKLQALGGMACFAVLALAFAYSGLTIWKMETVLSGEQRKLEGIQTEYRKYTATRTIVDKADVELLHNLQERGIFWTKKLAALANHLPENYSISGFAYKDGELRVSGHGFSSSKQDQLLTLDAYLNRLRRDTTFSSVFTELYLNTAQRDGSEGGKVAFEFSAINPKGKPRQ